MERKTPDPVIENPGEIEVPDPQGPTRAPRPGPEIQEPPPAPVEVPQPGIPATPDRGR